MSTRPSQPMRVATSIAYTMSSELRPVMPGDGSADRIDIDVSERTNTSRKYASAVKQAFRLPASTPSGHPAPGKIAVHSPSSGAWS